MKPLITLLGLGLVACLPMYTVEPALTFADTTITAPVARVAVISATTEGQWRNRFHYTVHHLLEQGIDVVPAPGRWETEADALRTVCRDPAVNGLVLTDWNLIELWDCGSGSRRVSIDGQYGGIPKMVELLAATLRRDTATTGTMRRGGGAR